MKSSSCLRLCFFRSKVESRSSSLSKGYGGIALKYIMDCHFPTINTPEKNLKKLVEVFGTYVVYCLIEAARLITANKNNDEEHWHSHYFGDPSNFKEGKFRERRFVNSWIKDIFDPWQMLNLFLTAVSNTVEGNGKARTSSIRDEETILQEYSKQYRKGSLFPATGVFINPFLDPNKKKENWDSNNDNDNRLPPTTLDLFFKRMSDTMTMPPGFGSRYEPERSFEIFKYNKELYHLAKITTGHTESKLLYELDSKKIEELKKALSKHYPWNYRFLQKTDELFYSK